MNNKTILITVDALRADHLSQYGYQRNTMPILDDFIEDGIIYTNAFANGSSTKVSIPSFLTSRYDGHTAMEEGPTLFSELQKNGIRTGAFHSNVLLSNEFATVYGCEDYQDFSQSNRSQWIQEENNIIKLIQNKGVEYASGLPIPVVVKQMYKSIIPASFRHNSTPYVDAKIVTNSALNWIQEQKNSDFFLWVHYMEPHRPYGLSQGDLAYTQDDLSTSSILDLMAKAGKRPHEITEQENRLLIDLYDSDIKYLSQQIRRLVEGLKREEIWEDLSVIFTSDHGEEFSEHDLYFHRNKPYDELIHVPLMLHSPNLDSNKESHLTQLLNIGPTILDFYGINSPESFQGVPLPNQGDEYIVSNSCIGTNSIGIRTNHWKYITDEDENEELYDISTDSRELKSVASNHPNVIKELQSYIPEELSEFKFSNVESKVDDNTKKHLKDLGYIE